MQIQDLCLSALTVFRTLARERSLHFLEKNILNNIFFKFAIF